MVSQTTLKQKKKKETSIKIIELTVFKTRKVLPNILFKEICSKEVWNSNVPQKLLVEWIGITKVSKPECGEDKVYCWISDHITRVTSLLGTIFFFQKEKKLHLQFFSFRPL